ncbi:putative ribonuclease h protein [Nicotiana attenuata]|uniref:Ribonuclease h protein n=1 Tax=Nicotiana attenuata TaxID=49451 RepID=A0A1J6IQP1_NICAT|nr:putative ribonuclease h protein [Nicotiana attenuata]
MEYLHLALPPHSRTVLQPIDLKWAPPNPHCYKLNSDGASCPTTGLAGYGGVIRDSNGNWIVGYSGSTVHTTSLHMELMGLLQGLRLAQERNLTPLEVFVDAKEVIHVLNVGNLLYSHILNDCRSVLHQLADPPVTHTYREQNQVVDAMAKHGLREYCGPLMLVFEDAPIFVLKILLTDK